MKFLYATVLGLATLTLFSCHKDDKRDLKSPQPLLLKPLHNGGRLSDAALNQASLYYYNNMIEQAKENVPDFGRASGTGYQQGILSTSDVAPLSGENNVKMFFLSFPDGTVDTLQIDYKYVSDDEARENACYCNLPQISVYVNGVPASIISNTEDGVPVYKIPK